MKKSIRSTTKYVALILSLSLSVVGCGNNNANQSEQPITTVSENSTTISTNSQAVQTEPTQSISENTVEIEHEQLETDKTPIENTENTENTEDTIENLLKLPDIYRETFKEVCTYNGYNYNSIVSTESLGNSYIRTIKANDNSLISFIDKDSKFVYTQLRCGTHTSKYSTDISASNIDLENYNSLACKMYINNIISDMINNNISYELQYSDAENTVYNVKYITTEDIVVDSENGLSNESTEKEIESLVFIDSETGYINKISGVRGPINSTNYICTVEIEPIDSIDTNFEDLFEDSYKLSTTELLNMNLVFETGYASVLKSIYEIESVDYTGKIGNNIGIPTDEVYDGLDIPVQ